VGSVVVTPPNQPVAAFFPRASFFYSTGFSDMLASEMARRKKSRLKVAKEARRRARLGIGLPPTERTISNKREKTPKHKKTPRDLLSEV
jgi:hypothetical protein